MNIGIVNDLPLAVEALRRAIARRPEHRVLWVATDGAQAIDFCAAQPPDVAAPRNRSTSSQRNRRGDRDVRRTAGRKPRSA